MLPGLPETLTTVIYITRSSRLDDFRPLGKQLGLEDPVPETRGHAEAVLVVGEVVREVVLLEGLVPRGKSEGMLTVIHGYRV
jgi:hypothetical protein